MAPRSLPKEFIGKTGKFDYKNFDYTKFNSLSASVRKRIVTDSIKTIQDFLRTNKFTEETREAGQVLFAIDKANPSLNLGVYGRLLLSRLKHDSDPYLNEAMLNHLKQNDPYTFDLFARDEGWELFTVPDGKGGFLNVGDMFDNRKRFRDPETQTMEKKPEIVNADSDIRSANTPAEPTEGILSNKPLSTASPAEPGALTNPDTFEVGPKRLSYQSFDDAELNEILAKGSKEAEVSNQPVLPNVGKTIKEVEANAYTGNEPPIAGYDTPITPPGVHVIVTNEGKQPIDLTSEEITKFKPNSASPSPEAIGEAMRDATTRDTVDLVGDTTLKPEDKPAFLTKEGGSLPKKESTKVENATDKTTPEIQEGALTGKDEKPAEPSKGLFSKIGSHIGRNKKGYLSGLGGLGVAAYAINDLASDNSTIRSWFTKRNYALDTNNSSANQPRIKSLNQREGAYMPERLLRFRQDTQDPFISNTNVNVDTGGISSNEELPVQQEQQVVNAPAPENNATADYVRAAYNSYIPSDAGRAYQKAIYGDPLELDRMRLQQQQQQKWRDFVMRSGQSPAELVQRGLMPYEALQYV